MSACLRVIGRSRLLLTNIYNPNKYCTIHITSKSFTNEIIWRSITRDATSSKTKTYSFSDVYSKTKSLVDQPYESKHMEQTLIAKAESQRKLAPLHVARLLIYLTDLPYDLSKTRSISSLINMYITCYEKLIEIKPLNTISDCDEFYQLFGSFMFQQTMAIARVCHGILEKSTDPSNNMFSVESSGQFVSAFIDQFASGRLALRVISAHNLKLYQQIKHDLRIKTGIFEEHCDVMPYIQAAITDSSNDCKQHFSQYSTLKNENFVPKVDCIDKRKNKDGLNFLYIPGHLQMMVFELLKNSMRAVIEKHEKDLEFDDDKIDIVVVDGNDGSITIKISDKGGGIPRHVQQEKIWLYGYTTAFNDLEKGYEDNRKGLEKMRDMYLDIIESAEKQWVLNYSEHAKDLNSLFDGSVMGGATKYAPMFGLGYGLPMTKLYATYFGGNVRLQSVNGYGTDAYLFLNNLSDCKAIMSI